MPGLLNTYDDPRYNILGKMAINSLPNQQQAQQAQGLLNPPTPKKQPAAFPLIPNIGGIGGLGPNMPHPRMPPAEPYISKKDREKRRIANFQSQLSRQANLFQERLPNYTEKQYQALLPEYQRSMESGTKSIREGAARRGLLYSGVRQQAEGDLRNQLVNQLATSRVNIQREGEATARAKKEAAASVGLQMMMDNQRRAEELYNLNLSNQLARREAFGQIAQGVGAGIGAYVGGLANNGNFYRSLANRNNPTSWSANSYNPGSVNYGAIG